MRCTLSKIDISRDNLKKIFNSHEVIDICVEHIEEIKIESDELMMKILDSLVKKEVA